MPELTDSARQANEGLKLQASPHESKVVVTRQEQHQEVAAAPTCTPLLRELLTVLKRETDAKAVMVRATPKRNWQGSDRFPRSSQYRGVSRNGRYWQVSALQIDARLYSLKCMVTAANCYHIGPRRGEDEGKPRQVRPFGEEIQASGVDPIRAQRSKNLR